MATRAALRQAVNQEPQLRVRKSAVKQPKLLVYDVPSGMSEAEILQCVRSQNLDTMSVADFTKQFRLLFNTGPKWGPKVHWVVEVSPEVRRRLIDFC